MGIYLHFDDLGLCRGSGVLVKSTGGWKIARHWDSSRQPPTEKKIPHGLEIPYSMYLKTVSDIREVTQPMAKPNYSFEKRQRELAKKKKKEEKKLQKARAKEGGGIDPDTAAAAAEDEPAAT